jgi:hypothetical protein
MLGSAVIGGFILAMIEGTGILINRYSQMLMPQPGAEGKDTLERINLFICSFIESPHDLDKGKVDLSVPQFFGSSPGQSSSPSNFS